MPLSNECIKEKVLFWISVVLLYSPVASRPFFQKGLHIKKYWKTRQLQSVRGYISYIFFPFVQCWVDIPRITPLRKYQNEPFFFHYLIFFSQMSVRLNHQTVYIKNEDCVLFWVKNALIYSFRCSEILKDLGCVI